MFPAVTVIVGRLAYRDSVSGAQLIGIVVALAGIAGVVAL
jgi:multidrug transporter EmrE-like cation transporter